VLNPTDYRYLSETDQAFIDAFAADRKGLGLDKTKTKSTSLTALHKRFFEPKVYESIRNVQGVKEVVLRNKTAIKDEACAGISDIIDNMTSWYFRNNYPGAYGHEVSYYKKSIGKKYRETFANLFELRASKTQWDLTKELFPDVVARFEKLITEAI
jgi:KaiC/GvpD/RAD55 family RecA-like ATPase